MCAGWPLAEVLGRPLERMHNESNGETIAVVELSYLLVPARMVPALDLSITSPAGCQDQVSADSDCGSETVRAPSCGQGVLNVTRDRRRT